MGKPTHERLLRKLDLELFLSRMESHPSPKAEFEQYTVTETVAATMLYMAAYTYGDIVGKKILDLGCGTGRLTLGALFLGADVAVGVDIDKTAIAAACRNSEKAGMKEAAQWVLGDIDAVAGNFDTILQNPPFGVQTRLADRRFLEKALSAGCALYSLHNHPTVDKQLLARLKASGEHCMPILASPFISSFAEKRNAKVQAAYALPMTIPRMFDFHTKPKRDFVVDLYVIKHKN